MKYINWDSQYDKFPQIEIKGYNDSVFSNWECVAAELKNALIGKKTIVIDCYIGSDTEEIIKNMSKAIPFSLIVQAENVFYDAETINKKMEFFLTDDRVRGKMYSGTILDFVDLEKLEQTKAQVVQEEGYVLVCGFGASLITNADVLVYADMIRWEIQLRYRDGMPNFKQNNNDEDILIKYKRGFFVEWRIADRHKETLYDKIEYYLDTNVKNSPKMLTGDAFRAGINEFKMRPFRLVPYFDPGVWGGQWMKEVCDLDKTMDNYAWSFDGVPEENSVNMNFNGVVVQSPAMNIVKYCASGFLGEKVFARFGAEYPIRFDFLDTMGGQNLSLQVHPDTDYIREKFAMPYTQDESYYILDCEEGGGVFLGLKENTNFEEMVSDLYSAQETNEFDAEKYINLFSAKKHDHFLIPAGTVHCSTKGCMVLEVSATPYIFTFKLWDWNRVGLDGIPRPIHIADGEKVIRHQRTTKWVEKNLVNNFTTLEKSDVHTATRTGLHELEFIQTIVYDITDKFMLPYDNEFSMLNLVDGKSAIIESETGEFEPYTVHYAETFIIPANVKKCTIKPKEKGAKIKVLRANVRF